METQTMKTASAAALQAGMTLIEILIVVLIMATIATGVTVALLPRLEQSRVNQAKSDVAALRSAVQLYLAENAGKCPTVEDLKEERYIDRTRRTVDPWEQEFTIQCPEGDDPVVISKGPDKQEGTEDDVQ